MSCASAVPAELEAIFLPFIARFWPLWRLSLQKDWPDNAPGSLQPLHRWKFPCEHVFGACNAIEV
jgi:hypothetical protein